MSHRISLSCLVAACLVAAGLSGAAQAALHDRGGGLIYDDVLNVTWLQDANYAKTSGYDSDGFMTWYEASTWVDQLDYAGYSDWRLPLVGPVNSGGFNYTFSNNGTTDYGYGITSPASEMAYMFYVNLNNLGWCTPNGGGSSSSCEGQAGSGLSNTAPFNNLWYTYWSGTDSALEYLPGQPSVWTFGFNEGAQVTRPKGTHEYLAWAVRSGDVSLVPEPTSVWFMVIGLGILVGLTTILGRRHAPPNKCFERDAPTAGSASGFPRP